MTGRSLVAVIAALAMVAGCDDESGGRSAGTLPDDPAVQRDAGPLGRELFVLVDRAADYQGAHQDRPPHSLHQIGIDSLTETTARWITLDGTRPVVTVAYRNPGGRSVTQCSGHALVLEEASLGGGRFTVTCSLPGGGTVPVTVDRWPQ